MIKPSLFFASSGDRFRPPGTGGDRSVGCGPFDVIDPHIEAAARQVHGEVLAEISQPDEAVAHCTTPADDRSFPNARGLLDVSVGQRHRFVEFDPKPGRRRRNHIAFLPANRTLAAALRESRPIAGCFRGSGNWASRSRSGCSRRRPPARSTGAARSGRSAPPPRRPLFSPRAIRRPGRDSSAGCWLRRTPVPARIRTWW